jgi:hypothetical protein
MNYLTQYYKNLSEQLQYQLNNLHQNLQEAYPGGMTPGRRAIMKRAVQYDPQMFRSDYIPAEVYRVKRIEQRAEKADIRGFERAKENEKRDKASVSSMPGFHDSVVDHFSTAFSNKYAEHPKLAPQLAIKVAADLHKAAGGKGGFRDFDHASKVMLDYMEDSDHVRNHYELRSMEDSSRYGVHPDDVGDFDFGHDIDDDHNDISNSALNSLLKKNEFNQRNKKSADAYQAERAKHLRAGTYES